MHEGNPQHVATRLMRAGIVGTVVAALCCATPVLAILVAAVGLGATTGYLEYILILALVVFVGLAVYGYLRQQKASTARCSSFETPGGTGNVNHHM